MQHRTRASSPSAPRAGRVQRPPEDTPRGREPDDQPRFGRSVDGVVGLQRSVGNRAVVASLRHGQANGPIVQRDELSQGGPGYKSGASEQIEFKLGLNDPKNRVKISGKVTASRRGSKYLESPTGQAGPVDAKWSLGENKATLERAGGRTAAKLSSALARADLSSPNLPGFPGLKVRMSIKALEGKFDIARSEADLDLLKVTGAVDGDLVEMLDEAGLAHLRDRVSCKVSLEAEVALSVMDLARLKAAWRAKEEVKAAAEAAAHHGEDFARQAEKLKKLDAQHRGLVKDLETRSQALAKQQRKLDALKSRSAGSKRAAARLRKQIALVEQHHADAARALASVESRIAANRSAVKSTAQAARSSRAGLAAAGQKLMKAGRKLDGALKGVTGKLGQFGKKALEKTTKRIMAKLGKTLLAKGLAKLIPGLNIVSTIYDVGSILWGLASGDLKFGIPGLDEAGEGGTGDKDGSGSGGGSGSAGDGGTGDAGSGGANGGGTTTQTGSGPSKVQLTPTARALADAYAGTATVLDDDTAAAVNEGLPTDINPAELTQLVARIKAKHAGGTVDPYELIAQIAAELADIRAGGTTVTIDGKQQTAGAAQAEPPKSLLPGTRDDVRQILTYDQASGQVVVDPRRQPDLMSHVFDHADGLKVQLSSMDVASEAPNGAGDTLKVAVSITIRVVALPGSAATDYPWSVGQTETEKMTFLYNPKRDIWGEMDYSTAHKLIGTVRRDGAGWVLAGADQLVHFEHATVMIKRLAFTQTLSGKDGTVHRFVLDVVPTEITAKEAGYMNPKGWVSFTKGKLVPIGFSFTEAAPAAVP